MIRTVTDAEQALARELVARSCDDNPCKLQPCTCVDAIVAALASARAEGYRQGLEEGQEDLREALPQ